MEHFDSERVTPFVAKKELELAMHVLACGLYRHRQTSERVYFGI